MKRGAVIGTIIAIAFALLNAVLQMGLIRISLKISDGQQAAFSDIFSCYPLLIKYLLGALLYSIICLCGFILLIVPGVIWAIKFSQYGYLIIDRGYGPIEALKRSALITEGAKWDLFLFGLLLMGINLLGALCLMLGLFASIPISMVAAAFVYRSLQKSDGNAVMPEIALKTSIADELSKLRSLKDAGALTDEDWEKAKALYLGVSVDKKDKKIELIRKLHDLHKRGALSESEFNMKKWDILSGRDLK